MRSSLIIYNIAFFLFGNVLFANLHHLSHDHDHHSINSNDCFECIVVEESSNYIINEVLPRAAAPGEDLAQRDVTGQSPRGGLALRG